MTDGDDLEYDRKGKARPLVLLTPAKDGVLVDALATRFEVFAVPVDGDITTRLKLLLERLRVERPLLVAYGTGIDAAVAISTKRMPRGLVVIGEARERPGTLPTLAVAEAELSQPGRLVDRIAEFDAPLT
jgi:hypothetical protein